MSATVVLDRASVTLPAKVPRIASATMPSGGPVSLWHAPLQVGVGIEPHIVVVALTLTQLQAHRVRSVLASLSEALRWLQ